MYPKKDKIKVLRYCLSPAYIKFFGGDGEKIIGSGGQLLGNELRAG